MTVKVHTIKNNVTSDSVHVNDHQRCQLQENKNPQSDGQKSPEIPRSQFQGKTR